jgi:hypothetical protein
MSALWALSGSMDARLVADGKAADVAFDNYAATSVVTPVLVVDSDASTLNSTTGTDKPKRSKSKKVIVKPDAPRTAEVTIEGNINGKSFVVTRKRSAKKSELLFILDGLNMTTQSTKDTQALLVSVIKYFYLF